MRKIPLRARDGTVRACTLVDDADFVRFGGFRWSLNGIGYAHRKVGPRGGQLTLLLHREVLGLKPGDPWVDHKNGDKLDNRRSNLRTATASENGHNRHRLSVRNRSGVTGVSWHAVTGKWTANVVVDRQQHHLGVFVRKEDAAAAVAAFRAQAVR